MTDGDIATDTESSGQGGTRGQGGTPPVVTLFESYGAGASQVGPRVARALGVPFHEQAFSSEALENPPAAEDEGLLSRVLKALGEAYTLEGRGVATAERDDYQLVLENTRWVREAANEGGALVGRNGALILADWPGALHVLLGAPVETRIERAAAEAGIDRNRAAKRQRREDQLRADMSQRLYGWDPRDPTRYDLFVNTGTMSIDACVQVIAQASRIKAAAGVSGRSSSPH